MPSTALLANAALSLWNAAMAIVVGLYACHRMGIPHAVSQMDRHLRTWLECFVFMTLGFISISVVSPIYLLLHSVLFPMPLLNSIVHALSGPALSALVTVGLVWLLSHGISSISLREAGWVRCPGAGQDAVVGWLLPPVLFGIGTLISVAAGWADVAVSSAAMSGDAPRVVARGLLFFLGTSIAEEMVFRGFLLNTITRGFGIRTGVIVSSLLFAFAHSANPGVNAPAIFGTLLAGFLLAYAYVITGQLWLPIAFHWAWDFSESSLFGFHDSGILPYAIAQINEHGPDLWLGGDFGPEAGLFGYLAVAAAAGALYLYSKHRQRPAPVTAEEPS